MTWKSFRVPGAIALLLVTSCSSPRTLPKSEVVTPTPILSSSNVQPETVRKVKLTLILDKPEDLKVHKSDRITAGQILSERQPTEQLISQKMQLLSKLGQQQRLTHEAESIQAQAELATSKEALKNFESLSPFTQIDGYFVPLAHKLKHQELQRSVGEATTKVGSLSVRLQEAQKNAALEREQLQYQLKAIEAEFNKLKSKSPYTGLVKQIKISRGNGQELVAELKIQPDEQEHTKKPKADNQEPPSTLKTDHSEQSGMNQSSSELWQVLNVHDGDTIQVSRGNEKKRIRFACIDAPELNQPGGIKSRDNLRSLINKVGGKVRLDVITSDRYGRSVAEVWVGNQLAQSLQASTGNAYTYKQYQRDCPDWQSVTQAEQQAISSHLGVWSNPNAIKPWDWRRRERQNSR